jgi:hypothetical protein
MMKMTQICHSELTLESPNNLLQKAGGGRNKNNVINIKQQQGRVYPAAIYEK